jgi:HAMP domain-containing protein/CheY-like chemotaxis protein/signal transduction histidine kinase
LSVRLKKERDDKFGNIADSFNSTIESLNTFSSEVTRVAREVGTEGVLGGQASVPGVAGTWLELTNNVNGLAANLTSQVRDIANVTTAVANGDLTKKITVESKGEVAELKDTINKMVDNLDTFSLEVTRVAREVGTEGVLGGQASVPGVAGTWLELTNNVNGFAANLTSQVRDIAKVTTAVAYGDLTQKITVNAEGEVAELKDTINKMVDNLDTFSSEVTRVAREVGTGGILGGQASVPGVAGTWLELTNNVNGLAANLTDQVRDIANVTTAVANGDLTQKMTVESKGEVADLKDTINKMVDNLDTFSSEVTRVAREVGTKGKLGGQASVPGVAGTWLDLTNNVNGLAANLTSQVRDIAKVTTAVANGDLTQNITVEAEGEVAELKETINKMVGSLYIFSSEVTRVAGEVGTDGILGGEAKVPGVSGTWLELTNNVNGLAANLTAQVRDIAKVTTAVANGDLTQKITVESKGEVAELKETINSMVDSLYIFSSEVTRVAGEVGTEGVLGGIANVPEVAGTWLDLTNNVNGLAANLTAQVRDIAKVTTAVANGDLSQKMEVESKGEVAKLKITINKMVDNLSVFSDEVTRVAREVGTNGKLGGQANVPEVAGTWLDLTDNVNGLAANLTSQVRDIAKVTTAVANGDLTQKITVKAEGEVEELKETINKMVDSLYIFSSEVTRVAREVGTKGLLGGQASVPGVAGTWLELTNNVNGFAANLTSQVRDIAKVTTAVAYGDLTQKITVNAEGEVAELKDTINKMVDNLDTFSSEVTRVAREVGTEGILGGQASVPGVAGTWLYLTNNVNGLAANLTSQVRDIANVTTAVAYGDLSQKITVESKGEVAKLKDTINIMVDNLDTFSSEVTRVAREVGTEGILGGQASVPGVAGTWLDLTNNVNGLAANLTSQVRDIANVAAAVAKGDLSQKITIVSKGEIAELKNTINLMVDSFLDVVAQTRLIAEGNFSVENKPRSEKDDLTESINKMTLSLRNITEKNDKENWLKTGQTELNDLMRGEQTMLDMSKKIITYISKYIGAKVGVFYLKEDDDETFNLTSSYAFTKRKQHVKNIKIGEGIIGQAALERQPILLSELPEDYIFINSGTGKASPKNLLVTPLVLENDIKAVIELGSFNNFSNAQLEFLNTISENVAIAISTTQAKEKMNLLLEESQRQQEEMKRSNEELEEQTQRLKESEMKLQQQSEALRSTNEELEEKSENLEKQKENIEKQNKAIEKSKLEIEEKAEELKLSGKYKSEFLANMSHELRTPLNSLLILSKQLEKNANKNLTPRQLKDIKIIYDGGQDLLILINGIMDLSKVEAGKMPLLIKNTKIDNIISSMENQFTPVASDKGISFKITKENKIPQTILTDGQRVEQILKNLLSNAFKFTETGSITVKIHTPKPNIVSMKNGLIPKNTIAFSVIDTGIGIATEKQKSIFEAFQQSDGSISRKYGGTGLGLTISRELAALLGGELHIDSELGQGSTFTLYLPIEHEIKENTETLDLKLDTNKTKDVPSSSKDSHEESFYTDRMIADRRLEESYTDDRDDIKEGDKTLLVVEDDEAFANILFGIAKDNGYKCLYAGFGKSGYDLAISHNPTAIILDVKLPDIDGIKVLENLKFNLKTRHIPVHVISVSDKKIDAITKGALGFLKKPASMEDILAVFKQMEIHDQKGIKEVLLIEDDKNNREAVTQLIKNKEINITSTGKGKIALEKLKIKKYDCIILDLGLEDMTGFELLKNLSKVENYEYTPIIIYTGRELTKEEYLELNKYTDSIVVKGVDSPERLLDEVSLFLHSVEASLPDNQKKIINFLHDPKKLLKNRKILLVDDDMKNTYALSGVLSDYGMDVIMADNGQVALDKLKENPEVELVLMDIMMPIMDGYEATKRIREMPQHKNIPIIALTAKAMLEDKAKAIEAGANDYLTKPLDLDRLISALRVWLFKK